MVWFTRDPVDNVKVIYAGIAEYPNMRLDPNYNVTKITLNTEQEKHKELNIHKYIKKLFEIYAYFVLLPLI